MFTVVYLLLYSVFIASVHISAPDHWLTISFISRKKKWVARKEAVFSSGIGALHAIFSIGIAIIAVYIGLYSIPDFRRVFDQVAGYFLLVGGTAYGMYFVIKTLRHHFSLENLEAENFKGSASSFALGLSLSPDLAAVSVILLGVPLGFLAVGAAALVFIVTSMIFLPFLVLVSSKGIGKLLSRIRPEVNDIALGTILAFTGLSLIIFQ